MSIRVFRCALVLICLVALATHPANAGIPLPDKDSTAAFGSFYGLGFSQGDLYLHTGDSIYVLEDDMGGGQSFNLHMSGLESAFPGSTRAFEGTFATTTNGQALVSMGFQNGGVLLVDLAAKTTRVVPDFDGDGQNTDNIFSAAGRDDGSFFATWVSPSFFPIDATKVYHIDPVTLDTTLVKDVSPGEFSGGMAFDPDGNLVVGSFAAGVFPDPVGTANYFRIASSDLDQIDPSAIAIGSGASNGNGQTVVDSEGNIYFNTSTGIGVLRSDTSSLQNFFGDITDPDLFTQPKISIEALTYDRVTNSLLFVQDMGDHFELISIEAPEPASAVTLVAAILALTRPRRRYSLT